MKLIFKPLCLIYYNIYSVCYIYFKDNVDNRQVLPKDYQQFTKKIG